MMQDLLPSVGFRTIGIEPASYETWSGGVREECNVGSTNDPCFRSING